MSALADAAWRKSSRSNAAGSCVEVAQVSGVTGVRDSKDVAGPVLAFAPADWRAFTSALRRGTLAA
ncbi:DUF397 domain-containing protein [Longispora fulva]|uniref:DUF397 domain-containing protein n=1 Tax=Longispora fulva TaxID=619741 RepID=A0A8J7KL64_9ACTN|nr:DUF397 domain-containing protein [Longispora fulva]MBG6138949.1 hypothetical protein [Longispora fulva]GIG58442.1 DUF397 domain-containing protein [Longispora fulva]